MARDELAHDWPTLKNEAGFIWGKLTDEDLDYVNGDVERLVARIQLRYGYRRAAAREEVDSFLRRYRAIA
jgi:uncharacterized protein YjbJ (UPF0337 family)